MNEKNQFFHLLKPLQKQLLYMLIAKDIQILFLCISMAYFFWMIISRIIVIPFVYHYFVYCCIIILAGLIFKLWRTKPTVQDAVLVMNQYVRDDRVMSAYSFIQKDGAVEALLIKDAVLKMQHAQVNALQRKKKWFYPKLIGTTLVFLTVGILSVMFPNTTMEAGFDKGKEMEIVKDFKKDLEEEAEKADSEGKIVIEELLEKTEDAKTADQLMEQLGKELKENQLQQLKENMKTEKLAEWQKQLQDAGLNDLKDAIDSKDMQKIMAELKKLQSQFANLPNQQQDAISSMTSSNELGEEELAALEKQISEALIAQQQSQTLANLQQSLMKKGEQLSERLADQGLPPTNVALGQNSNRSNSSGNQNGSSQNGSQKGSNGSSSSQQGTNGNSSDNNSGTGQNGQGSSGGQNSGTVGSGSNSGTQSVQNGSGLGSGTGSDSGSGSGSGTGTGSGSGVDGQGFGLGAGFGNGSRDFLTIPKKIEGNENLEEDFGGIGEGDPGEHFESDGPVLRGTLRPYSEVFSEYESVYRESMDRVNLPSDLETIVRDYFSNVKP